MKKFLMILAFCLLLLAGCNKETETPSYPVEAFGINFEKRPQQVLSLSPAGEDIMRVLGYGHNLIDTDSAFIDKDYPEMTELEKLSPDLVILSPETRESIRDFYESKNINIITLDRFQSDSDMGGFLKDMALVFEGLNDWDLKRQQINFYMEATSSALKAEGESIVLNSDAPLTFLFVTGDNFALTSDTMEAKFYEDMGFLNLAGDKENCYVPFSELPQKPDILIYPSHLEEINEKLGGGISIPYESRRAINQSLSVYNFRKEVLEAIKGEKIEIEGNFMPVPEPPAEEG